MATYDTLRDRALKQVGCFGQSDAQTVAQTALEEAMKFVAFHVRIPSLIASATATAPASPELETNAISLTAVGGFNISAGVYQAPDRLYVKKDSTVTDVGTPYEYMEYHFFQDLKQIPANARSGIFYPVVIDERPKFCWTITPSGKVWATPTLENNVLTLFYRIVPAAYSGAATPEILPMFDHILVDGAVIALKEWLREPETISTLWTLFENGLKSSVDRYDLFLKGQRKRDHLKIHRSYRIRY